MIKNTLKKSYTIFSNLIIIALGSALCAIAVNGILIPQKFFGAGFTGVAILVHYIIPFIPVSLIYFIINIDVIQ